jgi:putative membrane protein (TIGR04086 family)
MRDAVLLGAGVALAIAVPAALLAQIADTLADDRPTPGWVYLLVLVVMLGLTVGGVAAGRRAPDHAGAAGALAGLTAIVVVQVVGILRREVIDADVAWATIPFTTGLGVVFGYLGGAAGSHWPGRTRP